MRTPELFISRNDWTLEIEYENGDRQLFAHEQAEHLVDIRDEIRRVALDVKSSVIYGRTAE